MLSVSQWLNVFSALGGNGLLYQLIEWRRKNMGGISFLEGKWKWEKNHVTLLLFSIGDFERIYLGFSGRRHMQIIESSNFKISREIWSSQAKCPSSLRTLHLASSSGTKPATEGINFFISFQCSPFYFWASLVFRKFFCLLSRKPISL